MGYKVGDELLVKAVINDICVGEFQAPYHSNKCHGCFGAANNDCERCTR